MESVVVLASTRGFSTIGLRKWKYLVKLIHELHNLPGFTLIVFDLYEIGAS